MTGHNGIEAVTGPHRSESQTQDYDPIADIYDVYLTGDETADACRDFYVRQLRRADGAILELGVGTGRVSRALGEEGRTVVGIDISQGMLERAKVNGRALRLVRGRMECLPFRQAFAHVICPLAAIGHMAHEQDCRDLFKSVHRVLQPGGTFIFDHFNLDAPWAAALNGSVRPMYHGPDPRDAELVLDASCKLSLSATTRTMRHVVRARRMRSDGSWLDSSTASLTVHWYSHSSLLQLALETGFRVRDCYGGFGEQPFAQLSPQMVWMLERAADDHPSPSPDMRR
jgi:ubiquinone/menaquinone biosynthesis C-methylase UbiE